MDSKLPLREAAICIDGHCGAMKPVDNGIPQGSPVSPILASYYSSELLELFSIPSNPTLLDNPHHNPPQLAS